MINLMDLLAMSLPQGVHFLLNLDEFLFKGSLEFLKIGGLFIKIVGGLVHVLKAFVFDGLNALVFRKLFWF